MDGRKKLKWRVFPCRRTLGRAMRRKARRLALAEAPNLFSLSYCVGKTLKSVHVCLQRPVFNALGAAVCRPDALPDADPGGAPKGASPSLGGGLNAIFCLVSGASSVGKRVAGVKQVWQCSVLLAVWRRYELRLLKLRELFPLQTHWLISMPRSSDNLGNKGKKTGWNGVQNGF